jgi:hypothetical protein
VTDRFSLNDINEAMNLARSGKAIHIAIIQ